MTNYINPIQFYLLNHDFLSMMVYDKNVQFIPFNKNLKIYYKVY